MGLFGGTARGGSGHGGGYGECVEPVAVPGEAGVRDGGNPETGISGPAGGPSRPAR